MQTPSLVQLLLTGLLASSTVVSFQVAPQAGGAAMARRYAGAIAALAIPEAANAVVLPHDEVSIAARDGEDIDAAKKKRKTNRKKGKKSSSSPRRNVYDPMATTTKKPLPTATKKAMARLLHGRASSSVTAKPKPTGTKKAMRFEPMATTTKKPLPTATKKPLARMVHAAVRDEFAHQASTTKKPVPTATKKMRGFAASTVRPTATAKPTATKKPFARMVHAAIRDEFAHQASTTKKPVPTATKKMRGFAASTVRPTATAKPTATKKPLARMVHGAVRDMFAHQASTTKKPVPTATKRAHVHRFVEE